MTREFPAFDTDTHLPADPNLLAALDARTKAALVDARPAQNATHAPMAKWWAAKGRADARTGHAKILVIGDSKSYGYPEGMLLSWPTGMMPRASFGPQTQPGASIAGVSSMPDPRWSIGSFQTVFGPGSGALFGEPGAGAAATYTPGVVVDTVDVWWYRAIGKGRFVVSIDGIAQPAIDTNSTDGSGGWRKTTFTVTANAGHSVSFARPTDGVVHFFVDAYQDTVKSIRLANWGVIGSVTDTWANGPYSAEAITGWAPDLTLIMLGTNDGNSGTPAATWKVNIEKIIDAAKSTGDVVLLSCIPSASGPALAGETAYRAIAPQVAAGKDVTYVDVFGKLGPYDPSLFADDLHPNGRGHANVARIVAEALRSL